MTLDEAVSELVVLRAHLDDLKVESGKAQNRFDELRKRLVPDLLEAAGLVKPDGTASVTHASGARVNLRHEVMAYVKVADQPTFFAWLRDHGAGDLIKETVNTQTLKAWAKEQLENGAEIPAVVQVTPETVAVVTRPKGTDL